VRGACIQCAQLSFTSFLAYLFFYFLVFLFSNVGLSVPIGVIRPCVRSAIYRSVPSGIARVISRVANRYKLT